MPHGDLSDITALSFWAIGFQQIFWPSLSFSSFGPLKPLLDGGFDNAGAGQLALLKVSGTFMLIIGSMMFQVWWDGTNWILPAGGFLGAAIAFAQTTFANDGGVVQPRVGYLFAALMVMGFIHLTFLRNKMNLADYVIAERAQKAKQAKKE